MHGRLLLLRLATRGPRQLSGAPFRLLVEGLLIGVVLFEVLRVDTGHIPLGDGVELHDRILLALIVPQRIDLLKLRAGAHLPPIERLPERAIESLALLIGDELVGGRHCAEDLLLEVAHVSLDQAMLSGIFVVRGPRRVRLLLFGDD